LNISGTISYFLGAENYEGVFSVAALLLAGAVAGAVVPFDTVTSVLFDVIDASIFAYVYFLSELFLGSTLSAGFICATFLFPCCMPGI
jgi:hypothetical protein